MKMQSVVRGRRVVVGLLTGLAGWAVFAPAARGSLTLTISEPGFTPYTATDNANTGDLLFDQSYGTFSVNLIEAFTNEPTAPAGSAATLDLESLNVVNMSNSGTNTLTITISDNGYTIPLSSGKTVYLQSTVSGAITDPLAGDNVTLDSAVIAPPVNAGLLTYTVPTSTSGSDPFQVTAAPMGFSQPASYALTSTTTLSMSNPGESIDLNANTVVSATPTNGTGIPEPVTLGFLAWGGFLLGRPRRTQR